MLTILTPAYNRGYIIDKVYRSLLKQKNKDFEWLIIDDGSSDDTKKIVDAFIKESKIKIKYYYKKNGGKHTAVNYGVEKAKGDYILILDSDDYLTSDALEKIKKYWNKYKKNDSICALSFLKIFNNGKTTGKTYSGSEIISNNIDFRYNKDLLGDMCEVYKTEILKKYPFPVFGEERFLSEAVVWNKIAFNYDTVYINEPIYICEYLEDGLSKSWIKQVVNNPLGARANNLIFMDKRFNLKIRIKNCILFNIFSIISNKKILKETKMKFLAVLFYIPCFIIAKHLIKKYKKSN